MTITFPGESPAYRAARDALLQQELELRRATEAVAKARRALPPGGVVPEEYVFERALGSLGEKVTLRELFEPGKETLAVYSYMFGPERERPCPMCTPLLDGLDAASPHIRQRLSLAVVAESPAGRLRAFAEERGWKGLQLVSAAGNGYNRAYFGTTATGDTTMLNLFRLEGDVVRHFWGSEMSQAPTDPGQDMRHTDMLNPVFNMLDLTPQGRGDFYTKLSYP